MKFLILTQFFPPEMGAPQTRLGEVSQCLQKLGHEVEVLTSMPNYPTGKIFSDYKFKFYLKDSYNGVTVHRFWLYASQGKSILRLLNYLSFMLTSLCGLFVCKKPDYIFINSGPLFLAIPGKFLSLVWRRPIIFNVADLWPRSVEKLEAKGVHLLLKPAYKLEAWAYRNAKFVTAVTEGIKEVLLKEKHIAPQRLLFMPNGVNTELYKPSQELAEKSQLKSKLHIENKFTFIYSGNHGYAHALDNVLQAAKKIEIESENQADLKKIHVLFVGDGSDKERLIKIKNELHLQNVSFVDPVSQTALVEYLQVCEVGLINIRNTHLANETRPAKMFPMMAMEKPILFAGFGEGADIIKNCGGGNIVPAEDPEALKSAMIHMFHNTHELIKMGQNNRNYVEKNLQFFSIVKSWLTDLMSKSV